MGKIYKKKRKTNKFNQGATIFFSFAVVVYLGVSLFVGTANTNLTMEIQNISNRINELKLENEKMSISISSLENKDRVYTMASDAGLDQNQDNLISLQGVN